MMKKNIIQVEPFAYNLIESMRSVGYSFETALSDIIDNSISAMANSIKIFLNERDGENYVQIIDNGSGMAKNELISAMRLGSKNPTETRETTDLGRFGLGLKSASFSQCKILTVFSKKGSEINALQWDLNHVANTNSFDVIILQKNQIDETPNINILKSSQSGTIVMWQNFDKISSSSNSVQNELRNLMNSAIDHISLVYHRYIESGLSIFVNGGKIEAKDPFLKNHMGTQLRQRQEVFIDDNAITLQPYVLPHFSNLTPRDKRLSGKINEQFQNQGLYIYRNKRLIVWGSYFGLLKKTELSKNLRIQVDIPNSLDYLWDIDIKKSQARIPTKIIKNILPSITDGEFTSKKVNVFKGKKEISDNISLWEIFSERDGNFRLEFNKNHPLLKLFTENLSLEQDELFKILQINITENIPINFIYSKIAGGHNLIKQNEDEELANFKHQSELLKNIPEFDYTNYLDMCLASSNNSMNEQIVNYIKKEKETIV